ncbi:MAG TPA: CHAP domain-containing protein [Patescibacteria group bacterium]|nr:CHAP domain-containing protein [Patescibacteria group bacterium]
MAYIRRIVAAFRRFPQPISRSLFALCVIFGTLAGFGFDAGRREQMFDRVRKMPRAKRSPEEMRGLLNGMIHFRALGTPAFIPQSMWGRSVCAASVIEAANFVIGEPRLKVTDAWTFARENRDKLELVWRRDQDFAIVNEKKIQEQTDRGFWLSQKLGMIGEGDEATSDRIYIIGYRYHQTQADPEVVRRGQDLNTHLMLVLGRTPSAPGAKLPYTWWGYHMFHDPENPTGSPFHVEPLGERLPEIFDLVYIWAVKGTEMPVHGKPLLFWNNTRPYKKIGPYLGKFGGGRVGYVFDTAIAYYLGDRESFPLTLDMSRSLVPVVPADSNEGWRGQVLGFYNEIPVRRHRGEDMRGVFGLEFECVELVNRYYYEHERHKNMSRSGHADSYFYDPGSKKLVSYANGSATPPQVNDILVFDRDSRGGDHGHVAIVTNVGPREICVVQQHSALWHTCLPMSNKNGLWTVGALLPDLPCVGWSRKAR